MLARRNSAGPARLSIVGTRAAGKSTCIGLLNLTAMDLKYDPVPSQDLYLKDLLINELSSAIREVVNNLQRKPTPTNNTFIGLVHFAEKAGPLRTTELNITDVAGETVASLMSNFAGESFISKTRRNWRK